MNKLEAKNLIFKTFENPFNETQFTSFIKNLLNDLDESKTKDYRGNLIPDAFSDTVSIYKRIGQYRDPQNNEIDILTVKLKKETSLERARSLQRNFIARYLKQHTREAALVAYFTEGSDDWRFSFVKMDINLKDKKIETDFSPARRYSFLVGTNEGSHTAQNQFVKLLSEKEENPTLNSIENAFNIETVTKEFFIKYRELFIHIKQSLDKVIKNDPSIEAEFKSKEINSVDFAKKLLGQIVFLYFLQKKGWFGVEKNSKWGSGSKKFLREIFEKKHGIYNNFFNDILEPLFYEALSDDRSSKDHYYSRFNCKIPFLNGGLFDPIGNYDWSKTDIILPNDLFSNTHHTKKGDIGDGILDVFDRYNFTVIEDEPLEKEVAIDPELLGKAYEKFNAIRTDNFDEYLKVLESNKKGEETKFNKQYGVFYTPREIVHYMCQQSLINYLTTGLDGKVRKEAIEFLILEGEKFVEHLRTAKDKNENNEDYSGKYKENSQFTELKEHANEIDQLLANVKMCDPAVGSGAFPVGMMTEIVKARMFFVLTNCLDDKYINPHNQKIKRNSYNFKRDCIENSLYGVDIDSGAVEITKLRLWLSLVVDEDDITNIKPLPNLDYKIVCGNSLLGFPENWKSSISDKIESLKNEYFIETHPLRKKVLKQEIDFQIQSRFVNSEKNFGYPINFDFKTFFSEVYHHKGGFDIFIANPPFGGALTANEKEYLKKKHSVIVERIRNTFLYFVGEAYNQIKSNGIVCFILPNEFMFQIYMTKARQYFLTNSRFIFAINLGEDVFDAIVPTGVIGFIKTTIEDYLIPVADLRTAKLEELSKLLITSNFTKISNASFLASPNSTFSFDLTTSSLINRISQFSERFEIFCEDVANGISTSCDDVYIVSSEYAKQNNFEKEYLKECIRGNQFNRFYCPPKTNEYVLYITSNFDKKRARNIYEYLSKNKAKLIGKSVEKNQGSREWFVLFRARYQDLFRTPKIIFRQTGDRIISSIDDYVGYYCIDSVNVGFVKSQYHKYLKYFIGLLNSKLIVFFYQGISQEKNRVLAQIKPQRIKSLPIRIGTISQQEVISNLVNDIVSIKQLTSGKDNPVIHAQLENKENEIDILVYKLYNLTYEEIEIVDPQIGTIISKIDYEKYQIQ